MAVSKEAADADILLEKTSSDQDDIMTFIGVHCVQKANDQTVFFLQVLN
jgi:hypothetical protein